jgi:hypothetical protein
MEQLRLSRPNRTTADTCLSPHFYPDSRPPRLRWRGLETWHGRNSGTLATERSSNRETKADLIRRAGLRPFLCPVLTQQFDDFDVADVLPPLASDGAAGATAEGEGEGSYNLMNNLNTGDPFVRALSQRDLWLMFMPFVPKPFNSCTLIVPKDRSRR